jgi:hypothetical protein
MREEAEREKYENFASSITRMSASAPDKDERRAGEEGKKKIKNFPS